MKIGDLTQLLDNRLREFKLSRDYAKMSGDLERMNTAEKEILALEDTLYQLNLLVDTSKSAAVREEVLSEVITDGSVSVLDEYDITRYATDPNHERKIMNILSKMGVMDTVEKIDDYIKRRYFSSPVTGEMIMSAAHAYDVDARLMMAIMQQDSSFGTAGLAVRTRNPGNVGNDDDGNIRTYDSWQEGVTAVAEWLNRHRGRTIIPDFVSPEPLAKEEGPAATSTPITTTPTATSTPVITTSTTTTITNMPATSTSSTSSPQVITPQTATTTPTTLTTTPTTSTSTPETATTTPAVLDPTPTETASSTPETTTTTPEITDTTPPESSEQEDN
jgi:hypothetical protein